MKRAGGVFVAMLLANFAFAQHITRNFGSVVFPGGTSATSPNISRNFGSVVFPGGSPTSPQIRTGPGLIAAPPAFNGRPAGSHSSFGGGNSFVGGSNSFPRPPANRGGGRKTPGVIYYPVVVGGYGGYYDTPTPGEAPQQQPNVTVVMPPQQQDTRPVIIQMGPEDQETSARRPERRYRQSEVEAAQPEPDAPHYLIAFKDHTIYSSVAYWFDGDTLHYFTNGNTHNQASVSLIDRSLTERLNREMGTDFKLPSEK
jgi:hypothetical protein